jgi:hypothetical protein
VDDGVKSVEQLQEEKRRAELSARIASGEFTVEQSGYALFNNLGMNDDSFVSTLSCSRIVWICMLIWQDIPCSSKNIKAFIMNSLKFL